MSRTVQRGPWRLDVDALTVTHVGTGYRIRLSECRTSAGVLDWIAQLGAKTWLDDAGLGALTRLLADALDVQGRLCSWGFERGPCDPRPALERFVAEARDGGAAA